MPASRHCRLLLALLLAIGFFGHVAYLTARPPIGLAGDEAHYWDWSRQLDWSYYSKGPAVAVLIRGGRLLFGDTLLGVRFPSLVLAVGTSLCTYWLTNRVFKSERLALGAVAMMYGAPLFIAGSFLMTIDAPFYFCWAMATCLGYLAMVEGKRWPWPWVGAFVGLGFLAKYAALLWLVGMMVYLLVDRRKTHAQAASSLGLRREGTNLLKTPGPWLATVIAFAFTIPVLVWNQHHGWVSFGHVARSTSENQNHFNPFKILGQFAMLVGSQVGLVNPFIFAFMVGGVIFALHGSRNGTPQDTEAQPILSPFSRELARDVSEEDDASKLAAKRNALAPNALTYLLAIGLPFFGFVSLVTLFKNTEPNWPAPTYFTLVPLAAWFVAVNWPRTKGWLVAAVAVGVVALVGLHELQWFYRIKPVARGGARLGVGYDDVGRAVSDELKTLGPGAMVIADKYQLAGLMAFYVDSHPKTFCLGPYIADPKKRDRLSQYDLWPDRDLSQPSLRGRNAVFVGHAPPDLFTAFDSVQALPALPIKRQGVLIRKQDMYRCYGFHGMTRPNDGKTKR